METFIPDVHPYRIVMFLLLTALSFSSCTTVAENIPGQDGGSEEKNKKESAAEPQAFDTMETEEASRRETKHPRVYDEAPSPEETEEKIIERSAGARFPKVPKPKSTEETPPKPLIPTKTTLPRIALPLPQIALSTLPKEYSEDSQEAGNDKEKSRVNEGATRKEQQEQQKLKEEEDPRNRQDVGAEKEKETGTATAENQKVNVGYDELLTVKEDTVATIPLKKEGWVFLSSSKHDSSLEFRGRENKEGQTFFTFFTGAPKVEDLLFQLQDLERGTLKRKTIRLRVLSGYEYTEVENGKEKEESPMPNPASKKEAKEDTAEKRYKRAKEHYQQEEYKKALAGFLSTYHMKKSPEIAEKIAELYGILGNHTAALTWLEKNLEAPSPLREKALKGIIDLAILEERVALLDKYADDFLEIRGFDTAGNTESLVHFYLMRKDFQKAIETLEHFFEVPRKKTGMDSLYYLLASIYERPGKTRNIKKAREYYAVVYDEYPLSSYWNAAKEKINYIDRYYLKIR